MKFNDQHIQLANALPGAEEVPSPKGRTFYGDIQTSHLILPAYIKLLRVEEIAKEALSAVLARKLHLPILQPYYVFCDPDYFAGYKQGNHQHVGFALEADTIPNRKIRGSLDTDELLKWPDILNCGIFDLWIANDDRYPNNLMYSGNHLFWLIDHDEAFQNISPSDYTSSGLLEILSTKIKDEVNQKRILKNALEFIELIRLVNWDEIFDLLEPAHITGLLAFYEKHISFLTERTKHLESFTRNALGVKQLELSSVSRIQFKKSEI